MEQFIVRTSGNDKVRMDKQVGRFFFSQNIPFNAADSVQFKKLCELLRPGYVPPHRKKIGGELLDTIYKEVKDETIQNVESVETVCLTQDGWSSVQNDPVIASAFSDGKQTYLLDLVESGTEKKTAEYCCGLIADAVNQLKEQYGKKVFATCTDNEAKMKKLRKLLEKEFPGMITYGCNSHYLALLENDVSNDDIMKHITETQKYFRNVHLAHGLLKDKGGCQPQIPNETRWNSGIACLETYLKNHHIYFEIRTEFLATGVGMPANVAKTIDNVGLLREGGRLLDQMKKFGVALDQLQSEKCSIGDACHIWYGLLDDDELVQFRPAILKRFKEAVAEPHILAYITHPKYSDEWEKNVDEKLLSDVEDWLRKRNPDVSIFFYQVRVILIKHITLEILRNNNIKSGLVLKI